MTERNDDDEVSRPHDEVVLSRDLAELRRSLAGVLPSPELGSTLGRYARTHPRRRSRPRIARTWSWAAAAATVLVGVSMIWNAAQHDSDAETPPLSVREDPMSTDSDAFIPVGYGAMLDDRDAFTVVRVKLDRMALVHAGLSLPLPVNREFVDADLMIGVDGTVIGIRFVEQRPTIAGRRQEEGSTEESI